MKKATVSIVVLNWNNYEDTAECLSSLNDLVYENYHIVLVDNGSTDSSAHELKQAFPQAHIIINDQNIGFAAGCNVGIRYSLNEEADCVLLINNDAVLESKSLGPAVKTLFSREDIGIVGGKIKQYHNPSHIQTTGVKRIIWPIMTSRTAGAGEKDKGQFDKKDKRKAISGALMLIKKKVFETVGLLPAEYFFSCEDIDFCLKVRKKGFQIMYEPKFVAYHKGGESSGESPKQIYSYFLHRNLLINRCINSPWSGVGRILLYLYARGYWYKRYVKRESLDIETQEELKKAIRLAYGEGRFIKHIGQKELDRWNTA